MRFLLFYLFFVSVVYAQPSVDAVRLKKMLAENHYQPKVIDDAFSQTVYDRTLQHLDPDKLFLTEADLAGLASFRNSLDEEWKSNTTAFVDRLTAVYAAAQKKSEKYLLEESRARINWNASEKFARGKSLLPAKNDAALRERWRLWIKFNVLEALAAAAALDSPRIKITVDHLIREEKETVAGVVIEATKSMRQFTAFPGGSAAKVYGIFLKSIAAAYDPHSLYLSPSESENFMGAVTSQSYSFGMELREDEDANILVGRLVPGGPAWKSGELHKGDILFSMKPENGPVSSLEGIGLDSLDDLLGKDNHLAIELTIRRANGERKTVALRREKITDESNIVKGFVLNGKNKVGYISLPGFYSEWGSEQGSSCASDMARQIIKLKRENIQGLIVDIRSNGGGSVREAIELAGIFIDEGPIALFKNSKGIITPLKDINRGTVYDGPLIVLVDGRSASASEILAAALQDYHRAVILGSATFGKATSQRVFSLDPANELPTLDPQQKPLFGFATVTIEKIYRVTGNTVQGNGVQPDIQVPTVYDHLLPHESELPDALPADSVVSKTPFKAKPSLPLAALQRTSTARVAQQPWFAYIGKVNEFLSNEVKNENQEVPLNWNTFLNTPGLGSMARPEHVQTIKSIAPPEFDRLSIARNPFEKETNERWIKNLSNDEYVSEAFLVLDDYISIKK